MSVITSLTATPLEVTVLQYVSTIRGMAVYMDASTCMNIES